MIRYLKYFTQDDVDDAVYDELHKDASSGENNPYVVGTILTNEEGKRIQHVSAFREKPYNLCIEHAPDEFVDYKVVKSEDGNPLTDVELPLTQVGECGFGRVVRVGMIPLYDMTSPHEQFTIQSRTPLHGEVDNPGHYFCKEKTACTVENTNAYAGRIPYCEAPEILFEPVYCTHSVRFASITTGVSLGCVIYCVYRLHDGRFVTTGYRDDSAGEQRSWSHMLFPVRSAIFEYAVCQNDFNFSSTVRITVQKRATLAHGWTTLVEKSGLSGYDQSVVNGFVMPMFYCASQSALAPISYGSLFRIYVTPTVESTSFMTKLLYVP